MSFYSDCNDCGCLLRAGKAYKSDLRQLSPAKQPSKSSCTSHNISYCPVGNGPAENHWCRPTEMCVHDPDVHMPNTNVRPLHANKHQPRSTACGCCTCVLNDHCYLCRGTHETGPTQLRCRTDSREQVSMQLQGIHPPTKHQAKKKQPTKHTTLRA